MSRVSGVPVHSSKFFIPLNHSFWVKHILTHPPTFEEVPQLQQPTAKPGTSKLARNASVIFEFLQAVWSIIPLLTDMTRTSGCSWDETMVVILRSWDITPRPYITMVIHNITFDVIIYIYPLIAGTAPWKYPLKHHHPWPSSGFLLLLPHTRRAREYSSNPGVGPLVCIDLSKARTWQQNSRNSAGDCNKLGIWYSWTKMIQQ